MDPTQGVYKFNCSGMVGWLLREYPSLYQEFWDHSGERPQVVNYCDRIAKMEAEPSEYWERITSIWDVEPGDIIAWKRPMGQYERYPSGHIMVAADKACRSFRSDTEALLTVIDSTKQPHFDDSREVSKKTGLGIGTVGIGIEEDGKPTSYFWRGGLSTKEIITWVGFARLKKV